jgi:hypothetical protein
MASAEGCTVGRHSMGASRGMGLVTEEAGDSIVETAEREWKRQRFVEKRDERVAKMLEEQAGPTAAELAVTAEQCKTLLDGGQGKHVCTDATRSETAHHAGQKRAAPLAE